MKVKIKQLINILEKEFPAYLTASWDNSGLQIGSLNNEVNKILICLDLEQSALDKAIAEKVDLIITHHPFFFKSIKTINTDKYPGNYIKRLIENNISVYSAHTNVDAAQNGLSQILAEKIGLGDIKILYPDIKENLYKLVVYVPMPDLEKLRQAICDAGAGFIGNYSDCTFRLQGKGTFKPREGSKPYIGEKNKIEEVEEFRLETIVPQANLNRVLSLMHNVHPYEEVAYDLYKLENDARSFSFGRKGKLPEPMLLKDFAIKLKEKLDITSISIVGELNKKIKNIALVAGSGASYITKLQAKDIDLLITGDIKYHDARDAEAISLALIDIGHLESEKHFVYYLQTLLEEKLRQDKKNIEILILEPISNFIKL